MLPHAIEELCLAISRFKSDETAAIIAGSGTYKEMMRYIFNGHRGKYLLPEFYRCGTIKGVIFLQTAQIDVGIFLTPYHNLRDKICKDHLQGGRYGKENEICHCLDQTRGDGQTSAGGAARTAETL